MTSCSAGSGGCATWRVHSDSVSGSAQAQNTFHPFRVDELVVDLFGKDKTLYFSLDN